MATHCHGVWRTPACSGLASHPPASELGLCGPTPRTPRGSGRAAPGLLVQESSRPRVPAPFWGLSPSCCSSWKGLVSQHLSPGWQGDDIGWLPRSPVSARVPTAGLAGPSLSPPSNLSGPCSDPSPPVPIATGPLGGCWPWRGVSVPSCAGGWCRLARCSGTRSAAGVGAAFPAKASGPAKAAQRSCPPAPPQVERVRQWEARQLQNIEEATWHELTVEDDPPDTVPWTAMAD